MPKDVRVKLTYYDIRPHTELTDILCEFVNQNQMTIRELKGGDPIPQKINLSKPIDEIIQLFGRKYLSIRSEKYQECQEIKNAV